MLPAAPPPGCPACQPGIHRRSFVFLQWLFGQPLPPGRHEQLAHERRDQIGVQHGVDTVLGSCHALHDRRPLGPDPPATPGFSLYRSLGNRGASAVAFNRASRARVLANKRPILSSNAMRGSAIMCDDLRIAHIRCTASISAVFYRPASLPDEDCSCGLVRSSSPSSIAPWRSSGRPGDNLVAIHTARDTPPA
jgi:hypothetical protein